MHSVQLRSLFSPRIAGAIFPSAEPKRQVDKISVCSSIDFGPNGDVSSCRLSRLDDATLRHCHRHFAVPRCASCDFPLLFRCASTRTRTTNEETSRSRLSRLVDRAERFRSSPWKIFDVGRNLRLVQSPIDADRRTSSIDRLRPGLGLDRRKYFAAVRNFVARIFSSRIALQMFRLVDGRRSSSLSTRSSHTDANVDRRIFSLALLSIRSVHR